MMGIFVDQDFTQGWITRISGDGTANVSNGILTITGTGLNQAMKDYYVPVQPGQEIEVEVMAKSNNGLEGRIAIDSVDQTGSGPLLDYIAFTSQEWREYRLKVVVPYSATRPYVRIVLGKWSSQNQNVDISFQNPKIRVGGGGVGSNIIVACGLVVLNNGTVSLSPTFRSFGVQSVSYNGTTDVTVTLKRQFHPQCGPVLIVSGTPDNSFIPVAGNLSGNTFIIKWTNGTAIQNVSTGQHFAFFELFM